MRTKQLFRVIIAAAVVSGASLTATAQQKAPQTAAPQKQEAKPIPVKTAKVWSDDDLTSLRSPADIYAEEKQAQAAQAAAAAKQTAAAKQAVATKPTQPHDVAPPALSNPKTTEDADKMIAWENRDIAAQQQFAQELQKQLDAAPPDQQEHLQKALQERMKIIADTQRERDGIVAQEKQLEKKPAAGSNAPATPPPSQ